MEKEKNIVSGIKFTIDAERNIKVMKIRNALKIDDSEASNILRRLENGECVEFDNSQLHELNMFGVRFNVVTTRSLLEREAANKLEREERELRRKEIELRAEKWFETLSKDEQNMVLAYGYKHCQVYAVG